MNIWDRLATAGLAAVLAVAVVVEGVAVAHSWGSRYWLAGGAAAVVVCALALVRHRNLIRATAAAQGTAVLAVVAARVFHLPTEPGPAIALALAVLLGSAVRRLALVPAVALATGGLLVVCVAQFAARPHASGAQAGVAMNAVAWLGAVGAGLALWLMDERAKADAERVRREERLELARELHDVIAVNITGMLIQAQAAHVVARRTPHRMPESLAAIESAGAEALRAMRRLVRVLRDTDDAPQVSAGPEQLGRLVERFNRQGPPTRLLAPDDSPAWPPEVTSTVYRVVREALTNVAQHAPHAGSVTVSVEEGSGSVTVEVSDDAPAVAPRPGQRGGYGLIGMRERVEALGGTLGAGPRGEAGWSVLAVLPVPGKRAR